MNSQKRFELRISDLDNAAHISQTWATHTISILDSDFAKNLDPFYEQQIPQPSPNLSLHRCYFDDVTPNDFGFVLAKLDDIQSILKFTEQLQFNHKLLVHCSAGISRSTAVACGILCQHGLSPQEALENICIIRKGAYPNHHIISLMDEVLALKGSLKSAFYKIFDF